MAYPDGAALLDYLGEMGLAPASPSPTTADRRALAAAQEWERLSGWLPFLAGEGAEERTFRRPSSPLDAADDPFRRDLACHGHGGRVLLDLRGAGLLRIDSVTAGDRVLEAGKGYLPSDWGEVVEALWLPRGHETVTVAGLWGRVADLPPEVEEAVLAKGALAYVAGRLGPGGLLTREKAGPVEYQYSDRAPSPQADALRAAWDGALESWRFRGLA